MESPIWRKNPHAQKVAELRTAMIQAITPADIQDIIRNLVNQARKGCVPSSKILLHNLFPVAPQPWDSLLLETEGNPAEENPAEGNPD